MHRSEVFLARGEDCSNDAIQMIWDVSVMVALLGYPALQLQ